MIISFRGYVVSIGKPAVKVADSLITVAVAKKTLMNIGLSNDDADEYIRSRVKEVLEHENE